MLVLSRKLKESIVIDGKIVVKVLAVFGTIHDPQVKLGIEAPREMAVHREEIEEKARKTE